MADQGIGSTITLSTIRRSGSWLSPLENAVIASTLATAIDQLVCLGISSSGHKQGSQKLNTMFDPIHTRAVRYGRNDPLYNCHNGEKFTTTLEHRKYSKIHDERKLLIELLTNIKDEIFDSNTYDQLIEFSDQYRDVEREEKTLLSEAAENKIKKEKIKQELQKNIAEAEIKLKYAEKNLKIYEDKIEEEIFDDALTIRYLESWENARVEQGNIEGEQNEQELKDAIEKKKQELERELRINSEITSYIAENQKDMEQAIENWMPRYEKEMEEKRLMTQDYIEKREDMKKRYEEMTNTFEVHRQEIEAWLEYREKKRIQDEIDAMRYKAAAKIQAWWRGMMFKHQLGPWNPEQPLKKPKKKKKKDKKNKKGKKGKKKTK